MYFITYCALWRCVLSDKSGDLSQSISEVRRWCQWEGIPAHLKGVQWAWGQAFVQATQTTKTANSSSERVCFNIILVLALLSRSPVTKIISDSIILLYDTNSLTQLIPLVLNQIFSALTQPCVTIELRCPHTSGHKKILYTLYLYLQTLYYIYGIELTYKINIVFMTKHSLTSTACQIIWASVITDKT